MNTTIIKIFCLFISLLFCNCIYASRIDSQSFEPPFTSFNTEGTRIVSSIWRNGGVATVNENFIRLTPDQQSKKGALWTKRPLETNKFTSVLTFRISGEGRRLFGDGLAIWVLRQQNTFMPGSLHGINEKFEGFGIAFDTFKNIETAQYHKDVSVLVNDKSKNIEQMLSNVKGCDANLRYHEERGDFSVTNTSRAKIVLQDLLLSVFIDEKNTGDWKPCTNVELPFKSGWSKLAYIGISASTGQLTDRHDVISLVTYYDHQTFTEEEEASRNMPKYTVDEEAPIEERLFAVEEMLINILSKLDTLKHHFEHELITIEHGIERTIEKLQEQEHGSEGRIEKLEANVLGQVGTSVESRLEKLEDALDHSILQKLTRIEQKIDNKASQHIQNTIASTFGWKLPFLVFIFLIAFGAVIIYRQYQKLKKTHLL